MTNVIKKTGIALCALLLLSSCGGYKKKAMSSDSVEAALNEQFNKEAGDRVHFALNKSDINKEASETLKKQAAWLEAHSNVKATIEGHCDQRGTQEYNLALGERRANAAKKALAKMGVNESRLETISYGKERPAVIGNTDADFALNRRAVTVVRD